MNLIEKVLFRFGFVRKQEKQKQKIPKEKKPSKRFTEKKKNTIPRCDTTGKVCYSDKKSAEVIAENQQKNSLSKLRVYLCEFCGSWHLTHKKDFLKKIR